MPEGETDLEMAVRHVAEQENRIALYKSRIDHLRTIEAPLDRALEFLATMQDFLRIMRSHVTTLRLMAPRVP